MGPITGNTTSSTKPEVHNTAMLTHEDRVAENLVKFGRVVPEIFSRTDRQTDRGAQQNTPLPSKGGVGVIMTLSSSEAR